MKGLKSRVKIDGGAKKTMDTASTHGGILKSTQDDKSESKSFAGLKIIKFNDGNSDMKASKSGANLDTRSMGNNEEDVKLNNMSIEEIEKEIANKSKSRDTIQDTLTKMEKQKNRDKKKKDELKREIMDLTQEITRLEETHYKKIPLKDKLPKESTYYKHFMNKEFTSVIETEAVKQLQKDKEDLDEIGKEIA